MSTGTLLVSIRITAKTLLGTRPTQHHWMTPLQMRGVGRHGQVKRLAGVGLDVAAVATVILDIAAGTDEVLRPGLLEFREQLVVALLEDVHEHVDSTAMRHAEGDFLDIVLGGGDQQFVEHRDERLASLEAEPFLADVPPHEEAFQPRRLLEFPEDPLLDILRCLGIAADVLDVLVEPLAAFGVPDVRDLAPSEPHHVR